LKFSIKPPGGKNESKRGVSSFQAEGAAGVAKTLASAERRQVIVNAVDAF
jgi:hypothetical protein